MATEKEVLHGLLSTVYQIDENGVAELYESDGELKPEALQTLLERDAQRIAASKPDTKKYFDDGYKKGQSESLSRFEKEVANKYGIQSEKKGIELIEDLVAQFKLDNPDDPDKIKKSKFYIDAVEQANREKAELEGTWSKKFEDYQKQVEKEKMFAVVKDEALVIFENLKPILPTDAAKANNLKKVFLNELEALNYEVRDGQKILLEADNSDMVDIHGNRIKFESKVREIAEKYFEFYQSDDKNAPNHKQRNNNSTSVFKINSEADFINYMKTVTNETRPALIAEYKRFKDGL